MTDPGWLFTAIGLGLIAAGFLGYLVFVYLEGRRRAGRDARELREFFERLRGDRDNG